MLSAMRWGAKNPRRIFTGIKEEHNNYHDIHHERLFAFNWFNNQSIIFYFNQDVFFYVTLLQEHFRKPDSF